MPIEIDEYEDLRERKVRTNRELIRWMDRTVDYTTSEIRGYLQLNTNAVTERMKGLERDGFVESSKKGRIYIWKKVKEV